MTTEQAIKLLHRLQDEQFDGIHGDERREALSMAVRALEQNLVKESGGLVQDLVKDCISRKMAIDAVNRINRTDNWKTAMIWALTSLPPAQPTQTNAQPTQFNALDCVSRQAAMVTAIRAVLDWNRLANPQYSIAYCIGEAMRQLPSAQPKRKTGKWIDGQCSICGCDIPAYIIDWKWQKDMSANYCPNCGARMEGESE